MSAMASSRLILSCDAVRRTATTFSYANWRTAMWTSSGTFTIGFVKYSLAAAGRAIVFASLSLVAEAEAEDGDEPPVDIRCFSSRMAPMIRAVAPSAMPIACLRCSTGSFAQDTNTQASSAQRMHKLAVNTAQYEPEYVITCTDLIRGALEHKDLVARVGGHNEVEQRVAPLRARRVEHEAHAAGAVAPERSDADGGDGPESGQAGEQDGGGGGIDGVHFGVGLRINAQRTAHELHLCREAGRKRGPQRPICTQEMSRECKECVESGARLVSCP